MMNTFCKDIYKMLCQKYPNRNIYVIGDHHYYHHNILHYTRSNFSDILNMNEYIVRKHNETVSKEDIVIFLGDFCFKNSGIKEMMERMNGHKYLILGNHDPKSIIKNYPNLGLEGVFTTPIKIMDNYLSHEPLIDLENMDLSFSLILNEFKKESHSINYHGHIHTSDFISLAHKNVTCEMLDYNPLLIGQTENSKEESKDPSFISSTHFNKTLSILKDKHHIEPSILLSDYIYSMLLQHNFFYYDKYFVQGSFGLFKKYDYLSNFSDLDISLLYNPSMSKRKNISLLKEMADSSYELLKNISEINLRFEKRYSSLCIFEALYTSKKPYFTSCYFDANMIPIDCYKKEDFLSLEGISLIEKLLIRNKSTLPSEYEFPHFQTQFLKPEGDIANLLLQLLFQKGHEDKKKIILRKLEYVYLHAFKNKNIENFSNTFTRFLLRNISLLYSLNRLDEISYLQSKSLNSLLTDLNKLKYPFHDILISYDSPFPSVYKEIISTPTEETFKTSKQIVKKLK